MRAKGHTHTARHLSLYTVICESCTLGGAGRPLKLFSLLSCRTKKKRRKKESKTSLLLVHYPIWAIWSQIFCLNVTPLFFFFFFFCGRKTSSYSLTRLFLLLLLTDKRVYQLCFERKLLKNIVIFF